MCMLSLRFSHEYRRFVCFMYCGVKKTVKRENLKTCGSRGDFIQRLQDASKTTNYGEWTIKGLQEELKRRRAKTSGTKDQLIQRLQDYDRNNNFEDKDSHILEEKLTLKWPEDGVYKSVNNSSVVPHVDSIHINQFFLAVYKDNAGLTEYEALHRKACSMLKADFLCALVEVTYFVRVAFSSDGVIIQSECECAAGEPPKAVCKHVGVVCYAVLKFKEEGLWCIRKTCTQKKQMWHAPKKIRLNISPKKSEDLNLEVLEYGKAKRHKGKLLFDPRPEQGKPSQHFHSQIVMSTPNFCFHSSKRLGISGILPTVNMEGLNNDHDYFEVPPSHFQILNMIKVTAEQAEKIEVDTRKQANCKLWHSERSLRVTASIVGEICSFTDRRDQAKYAEKLITLSPLYTEAIFWGKSRESSAVECYEAMSHNTVQACSLFVCPEYPFIAGSPDGLIGQLTVLEVKCPFSIKNEGINHENYRHLEIRDEHLHLRKTSKYYYQVQTQMLVTGRDYCDFFVWTNHDEKRIYVDRDNECIQNVIIPRVKDFFYKYMLPALQKKYFS